MRTTLLFLLFCLLSLADASATIFGRVQGVVHDSQHRPISAANIEIHAANSALNLITITDANGIFAIPSLPLGDYTITVRLQGFRTLHQSLTLASDTSPTLHLELQVGDVQETVSVTAEDVNTRLNTATPSIVVNRREIAETPGADRTNSMAMITDFVPGAYMTHDMLHIRGGHQVSWLIDGVEIPNTNIASNLAAQIDPKDIDYLEIQRGSYTADVGDRTYGVFNVVPRTGFERNRQAELVLGAGNFLQTNDQLSLGDHTRNFAWYASLTGNRSDYGLAPPTGQVLHDSTNGYGGFASLMYNRTAQDQFRLITQLRQDFFQIPYDPNPNSIANTSEYDSSGLRDTQKETDGVVALTYLHTFSPSTVLQASPFFHYNRAAYDSPTTDTPVATTSDRTSNYTGGQLELTNQVTHGFLARNHFQSGIYAFAQHDSYLFGALFNDTSGTAPIFDPDSASGSVIEEYISDTYSATRWLTLVAGLRQSRFSGAFVENYTAPRVGVTFRIPRINWVFRASYDRFYQPPPLLTASGPVITYATANNTAFAPLHGERDEEHQFGVQIPVGGWSLDINNSKNRVNNFLDHSNIGASSIYFPVTIDGALVRSWELALHSPRTWKYGGIHLAYSNQIAEQRGNITGGLICTPVGDPQCDSGFSYTPVDHDQRNTLNVGGTAHLPLHVFVSTNVYYGSGFINGGHDPSGPPVDPLYPNQYLPQHTTFDISLGKTFSENLTASITATNVANRRLLLDNSLTFGGFHYNDPREIFAELRYRFKF